MEKSDFLRYRDSNGHQVDFHSLRHTFLSRFRRSGASAKATQPSLPLTPPAGSGAVSVARLVARSVEKSGLEVVTTDESEAEEPDHAGNA